MTYKIKFKGSWYHVPAHLRLESDIAVEEGDGGVENRIVITIYYNIVKKYLLTILDSDSTLEVLNSIDWEQDDFDEDCYFFASQRIIGMNLF